MKDCNGKELVRGDLVIVIKTPIKPEFVGRQAIYEKPFSKYKDQVLISGLDNVDWAILPAWLMKIMPDQDLKSFDTEKERKLVGIH